MLADLTYYSINEFEILQEKGEFPLILIRNNFVGKVKIMTVKNRLLLSNIQQKIQKLFQIFIFFPLFSIY